MTIEPGARYPGTRPCSPTACSPVPGLRPGAPRRARGAHCRDARPRAGIRARARYQAGADGHASSARPASARRASCATSSSARARAEGRLRASSAARRAKEGRRTRSSPACSARASASSRGWTPRPPRPRCARRSPRCSRTARSGDVAYFLGQLLDLELPGLAPHQGRRGRPAADAVDAARGHQELPRHRRRQGRRAARPRLRRPALGARRLARAPRVPRREP